MVKIKRVFNCIVPVTACNFKCHYCYIGQTNDFYHEIKPLPYDMETIVSALRPERIGESCFFNFCAMGETLLAPYLPFLCEKLLEQGHLVGIVTNGVLEEKIDAFCRMPSNLRSGLFFKFSFHYLELVRTNNLEIFSKNVNKIRDLGCSFTVELTVNDETIPYIGEIKDFCNKEFGAECHVIESRDNRTTELKRLTTRPYEEHTAIWGQFNSPLFEFQQKLWGKKQPEFCYAGDWLVNLFLETGDVYTCLGGGNRICNLYEYLEEMPIFAAVGCNCPWAHCYPAYVCLTLGTMPDLAVPFYSTMRNRQCLTGGQWLNETYQSAFGNFLKESNQCYSNNRKSYIDGLMAVEYKNPNFILKKQDLVKILEESCRLQQINCVAIFGLNSKQEWLSDLLRKTDIKIKFFVDDQCSISTAPNLKISCKRLLKYLIKKLIQPRQIPIVNTNDSWPSIDVLIVSDFYNYLRYKNSIQQAKRNIKIVSITELVK